MNLHFALGAAYFVYYGALGVFLPYWARYLLEQGFLSFEVGLIIGAIGLARMTAPNFWAYWAERSRKRYLIIRWAAVFTLAFFIFMTQVSSFAGMLLLTALFSFSWNAIMPQIEVICLRETDNDSHSYARIRLWGSVGFITMVFLGGALIDNRSIHSVPGLLASLFFAQVIILCLLTSAQNWHNQQGRPLSFGQLLTLALKPHFLLFFLIYLLLQISHAPYYTFFDSYLNLLGYSTTATGALIGLGVIAEIILFWHVGKLLSQAKLSFCLFVALLITAARWFALAYYADALWILILSQCCHAASFGLTHAVAVKWLYSRFPEGAKSQGQAFYASITWGIGGALGNMLSGLTWQNNAGAGEIYLWSFWLCLIAAALSLLWPRYDRPMTS